MDYFGKIKLLNRKKTDPYKFIFTGDESAEKADIQLVEYSKDFINEKTALSPSEIGDLHASQHKDWLNIYGLSDTELIASICKDQGIDNLVIQDILDLNQRPKYQEFDNYSFLTIKSTVPSDPENNIEQISFVFSSHFLISFQEKKTDHFDHLRYRLRENKGIIRDRGSDFLLYTMLEAILDNYFKTLDSINNDLNRLNLASLKADSSPAVLEHIEEHKVFVSFIKNAILPIKEFAVINERDTGQFIENRNLKFISEIKDLCLTLIESCDTILASLESSINLFFSIQGHRMNQVMKTLTIVATIFIPLTFVAGIYGMNFKYMPELEWRFGYAAVWGVIVIIFIGMIVYFRRKKWF